MIERLVMAQAREWTMPLAVLLPILVLILADTLVTVPMKHKGMVTRFGSMHVLEPGVRFKIPYWSMLHNVNVGFDTDFTENVKCISRDNVDVIFTKVYVDNKFSCGDNTSCYKRIFTDYFLSDAKTKAKAKSSAKTVVPEDGIIFKHMPETMAKACKTMNAHTMLTRWHELYPAIIQELKAQVPPGIDIIAIRTDRPIFHHVALRTSIYGIISSNIYVVVTSWL